MKNFMIVLAVLAAAQKPVAQPSAGPQIASLQWLAGTWKQTNAKPGRTGLETWTSNGAELKGQAVILKGADTVGFEKTRIAEKDGALYYIADVPENTSEVAFKMTKVADGEFVCENGAHDFPKRIHYKLAGTRLTATISGNGKSIEYLFERSE